VNNANEEDDGYDGDDADEETDDVRVLGQDGEGEESSVHDNAKMITEGLESIVGEEEEM
jgi:hypothetical protein